MDDIERIIGRMNRDSLALDENGASRESVV